MISRLRTSAHLVSTPWYTSAARGYSPRFQRLQGLVDLAGGVVVVELVPPLEVAEVRVVELHDRRGVELHHPLVQIEDQVADRAEVDCAAGVRSPARPA